MSFHCVKDTGVLFFFFASATKKRLSDEVKDELSKPKQKVEANNTVTMFDNS